MKSVIQWTLQFQWKMVEREVAHMGRPICFLKCLSVCLHEPPHRDTKISDIREMHPYMQILFHRNLHLHLNSYNLFCTSSVKAYMRLNEICSRLRSVNTRLVWILENVKCSFDLMNPLYMRVYVLKLQAAQALDFKFDRTTLLLNRHQLLC